MIGASPKRKEDRRLLVGGGRFVDDVALPGLLHLGVVRSAEAHARLMKVAVAGARTLGGVVAVWTAEDLPEVAAGLPEAYGGPYKGRPFVEPVIARDVVRHVGEPVAVVVADDALRLADAMESVTVEYEPLPPLADAEASLVSPVRLHPDWPDNSTLPVAGAIGDAAGAMAAADVVIEARIRHPRLSGMPIETRGTLAYVDEAGALVVGASAQNPYSLRDTIATVLSLPSERVRVVLPDVGGAFGPKGSVYQDHLLVAAAALRLRRPIKHVETRREHLVATGHDREQVHDARLGLRRDGTIVALEDRFLADVGAYPVEGDGLTMNTVNHLPGPYRVPHYRSAGQSVVTNKTQNAAYRGAGRPEAALVMERLMDLGARRLGLDPAELRRRNLVRPGEMPYRSGLTYKDGVPVAYDPGDFPAAFDRALALIGYEAWRARQRERGRAARRLGIGLACYAQGTGLGPYEGATVRVDPSGKVYVVIGVAGQGQGHATTLAQICAESLGAPLDDVEVVAGDTSVFPYGMGTGGSRVMANAGPAVARAAREVRA
ncbi:MAG: xanthine dehydrogenase family protein molybdopterin-binding subunit, partial [Candidatus Rokuibacteriota bacterium]